ncbi:MAG: alpha/beta fold hydrolase [Hyphomicrobiaceae bacterium]|nr:alpha/beta fold hydrolase [Hyphomicrobiaceae bacterium]
MTKPRTIMFPAADGYRLTGQIYLPSPGTNSGPVTIIGSATGVPQRFYGRFANYLAEHGRPTITFDYRGIGLSAPAHLRGFTARFRDWGILDIPAALDYAKHNFPNKPLHWIGHSYGGFGTGLAHNARLIERQLAISAMSADFRFVDSKSESWKIGALLFGLGPITAMTLGYVPGKLFGGTDLPKGVALEWSKWVATREFLFGITDLPERKYFADLRAPLMFVRMEDDTWLSKRGVEHLATQYNNATEISHWTVSIAEGGERPIGHLGFFRSDFRSTLWQKALAWLNSEGNPNGTSRTSVHDR